MAKRPSFQFYPADWRNNANLRRCSHAARGAWIDILSILHDSDEYGVCRWPLAELANAASVPFKLIKELVDKNVLKGSDDGISDFVFKPRHAGKEGAPITLISATTRACWYCSRFVRDEYIRTQRGKGTRFGDERPAADPPPTPRIGEDLGDGPSSTSTSTSSVEEKKEEVAGSAALFEAFWIAYDKDIDRHRCEHAWFSLTVAERHKALQQAPLYVSSLDDLKFQLNPLKWLENKRFNDDLKPRKAVTASQMNDQYNKTIWG